MASKTTIAFSLIRWIWCFICLFGTAYIVFGLGQSGWWWLLGILLMGVATKNEGDGPQRVNE